MTCLQPVWPVPKPVSMYAREWLLLLANKSYPIMCSCWGNYTKPSLTCSQTCLYVCKEMPPSSQFLCWHKKYSYLLVYTPIWSFASYVNCILLLKDECSCDIYTHFSNMSLCRFYLRCKPVYWETILSFFTFLYMNTVLVTSTSWYTMYVDMNFLLKSLMLFTVEPPIKDPPR